MPRTLLLADGNTTIHRVVALTFAGEDIRVISVSDGDQAIARITAEPPDIVLADITMSKRNGYDVAAFVKGQPALAHIPVLLLAGALEPVDEERAAQVHCDGVLVKPFEPQHMIARVRELMSGGNAPLAPESTEPSPRSDVTVEPKAMPALPPAPPPAVVERRDEPSLKLVRPPAPVSAPLPPVTTAVRAPVKPAPAPVAPPPPATEIDDDPLADYFDQLDAAFDSLEAAPPQRSKPLVRDDETETMVIPTFNNVLGDLSRDAPRPKGPNEPILFGAPPLDPPDIRAVPAPPSREMPRFAAVAPPEPRQTHEPPPAYQPQAPAPAPEPAPRPGHVAPEVPLAPALPPARAQEPVRYEPAVSADSRRSAIADAFEALLAVEEEQRLASQPRPVSPPVVISDELIEAVANRVLARLAPGGLTEMVSRVVSDVAERLVREEIDRIRGRK
jgi:CheY-like chemotaxis protein